MSDHAEIDAESGRTGQWVRAASELALLSLLDERPHYGLEMVERLRRDAGLPIAEGTIYPLLHRLERAGAVRSEWRIAGSDRPRKYYALTAAGAAESRAQAAAWRRLRAQLDAFLTRTQS
jgi:PadR family transcriptional regulator PadR